MYLPKAEFLLISDKPELFRLFVSPVSSRIRTSQRVLDSYWNLLLGIFRLIEL
ncbi:unnamed protein product [Ectocarpus sp. 6 AP-2014]